MSSSPPNFESERESLINHSEIEREMNDNWNCNSQLPVTLDDSYSTFSQFQEKLDTKLARITVDIQSKPMNKDEVNELRFMLSDIYITLSQQKKKMSQEAYEQEFKEMAKADVSMIELAELIKNEVEKGRHQRQQSVMVMKFGEGEAQKYNGHFAFP